MMLQVNKTILLVEDEPITAAAEAESIRRFGYDVLIANNGGEAIRMATGAAAVDLVLMDIDLGKGMDGTEAAKRILEEKNIPIVFLTAHGEREMVESVQGVTRYGYVIKNSGSFVLQSSIDMAFELFDAHHPRTDHPGPGLAQGRGGRVSGMQSPVRGFFRSPRSGNCG